MISEQQLVSLPFNSCIGEALTTWGERGISSAPVLGEGEYNADLGCADQQSVLGFLFSHEGAERWNKGDHSDQLARFFATPVREVVDVKGSVYVSPSATLLDVCKVLSASGAHRVLVSSGARVVGVVSQFDVIRFAKEHLEKVHRAPDSTIEQLVKESDLGSAPVATVATDTPTGDALKQLSESAVSALAVVNGAGGLVASLSLGSVRGLRSTDWPDMAEKVGDFVLRGTSKVSSARVFASESLRDMITRMVDTKSHRIYVVSQSDVPERIITLTDLINLLLKESA